MHQKIFSIYRQITATGLFLFPLTFRARMLFFLLIKSRYCSSTIALTQRMQWHNITVSVAVVVYIYDRVEANESIMYSSAILNPSKESFQFDVNPPRSMMDRMYRITQVHWCRYRQRGSFFYTWKGSFAILSPSGVIRNGNRCQITCEI